MIFITLLQDTLRNKSPWEVGCQVLTLDYTMRRLAQKMVEFPLPLSSTLSLASLYIEAGKSFAVLDTSLICI